MLQESDAILVKKELIEMSKVLTISIFLTKLSFQMLLNVYRKRLLRKQKQKPFVT